jgi:hypothetical protein
MEAEIRSYFRDLQKHEENIWGHSRSFCRRRIRRDGCGRSFQLQSAVGPLCS